MGDLEKLLAARREIDRALLEQHSQEAAVMFTDIVGSTAYYESHGDIAGLALVRRHNELLFPLVEQHQGRVIKTVGDAIMASFEDPAQAIWCALEMQRVLERANQDAEAEPIHVRIGAHTGRVMVDGDDLFGDTVNTAARIAHEAGGDQVLVSRELFKRLPDDHGLMASEREPLQLKGKTEPLAVVELRWQASDLLVLAPPGSTTDDEIFMLELGLGPDGLRVTAVDGSADKGTVKVFAEVPLRAEQLDGLGQRFDPFLHGDTTQAYAEQIRECGEALYQQILSDRARRRLEETELRYLRLHVDDRLVHLPWELWHDGLNYAGLRFAIGRMVSARSDSAPARLKRDPDQTSRALVVSNPSGDLPDAAREGKAVATLLERGFAGQVRHLEGPVNRASLLAALDGCRLLHFAGHARRSRAASSGGLQLSDGVVSAVDLAEGLGQTAPDIVFLNSCHASTGAGWVEEARGLHTLAAALLTRGTRHYLAPMWEIPDDHALGFALRFYEQALAGTPYGEAVRAARKGLEAPGSFGGYVLYGDPRGYLVGASTAPARLRSATGSSKAAPGSAMPAAPGRAAKQPRSRLGLLVGAALVGLLGLVGIWRGTSRKPPAVPSTPQPGLAERVRTAEAAKPEAPTPVVAPLPTASADGPVRLSILPFKNLSGDPALDFLGGGIAETLVTDFGQLGQIQLIERGQIEVDIEEIEFSQSKYVDPATRAVLGKIKGAEVVVLGGFQRAGGKVRASARYVLVETGEVLEALRVERSQSKLFELQDELAKAISDAAPRVEKRLRP